MSTPLKDKAILAQLKALGIPVTTEEKVKKSLLKILEENDISGMEDEEIAELAQLATDVSQTGGEEEVEEVEAEVEEEAEEEELEETPAPKKKATIPAKKKPAAVEEEENEEELLEEVAEQVEEERENKPAKKKAVVKPAKANADGLVKWDGQNNPKHVAMLKIFDKWFPKTKYEIFIKKTGFVARLLSDNTKPTIMNIKELKIQKDGKLTGNMYANRIKTLEELSEIIGDDFETGFYNGENHVSIRNLSQEEMFAILEDSAILEHSIEKAKVADKRMGVNRAKLEESLQGEEEAKPAAKKKFVPTPAATKKKAVPVEEEETEELEEETEEVAASAPKKKFVPAPPKKKAVPAVEEVEEEEIEEEAEEEAEETPAPAKKKFIPAPPKKK